MLFGQFIETSVNNLSGDDNVFGCVHLIKLNEQAFFQVACCDAWRVEFLDFVQDFFDFLS